MNTELLINHIANSDQNANDLLNELNPKLEKRFIKACKELAKIVDEIREVYPDANIYVQEDQPLLLLGDSHTESTYIDNGGRSLKQMVAVASPDLYGKIDGGGW